MHQRLGFVYTGPLDHTLTVQVVQLLDKNKMFIILSRSYFEYMTLIAAVQGHLVKKKSHARMFLNTTEKSYNEE